MEKLIIVTDAHCVVKDAHLPGRAGFGRCAGAALYLTPDKRIESIVDRQMWYLGDLTVPQAEYETVARALDYACALTRENVEVWSDSDLVIRQLNMVYRIKKDHLKPLYDNIRKFERRFRTVAYFHHSRTDAIASEVDKLARQCYSEKHGRD